MRRGSSPFDFETVALRIRPLAEQDRDIYCLLYTDRETMRFVDLPLSQERAQRSFAKALALTHRTPIAHLFLVVIAKGSELPIGVCSIQKFDRIRRAAEVGIMLKPEAQGRGVAREALSGLIDHAFSELPIDRVWAEIPQAHESAAKVLINLGFCRESNAPIGGDAQRQCTWFVTRSTWRNA